MSEKTASIAKHSRIMSAIASRIEDIRRRQRGIRAHLENRICVCDCEVCLSHLGREEINRRIDDEFRLVLGGRGP